MIRSVDFDLLNVKVFTPTTVPRKSRGSTEFSRRPFTMDREFTNCRREFVTYESAANESAAKTVLVDSEALDLRFQRGGGHAELGGSPAGPRNPATAFREY